MVPMMGLALIGRGNSRSGRFALVSLAAALALATGASAAAAAAPSNDAFAAAETITGYDVSVDGTTVGATREAGEPSHGGYDGGHSVWYRWVAPFTGTASVGATEQAVGVYTGDTLNALVPVEVNNPIDGMSRPTRFRAVGGTTYLIAVDSFNSYVGYTHAFTLTVSVTPPPANDDFAASAALAGAHDTASGNNRGATFEPREVFGFNGIAINTETAGARTVWYSWTAPSTGGARVDTAGSEVDTVLSVYTGDSVSALVPVAGDYGPSTTNTTGHARASFRAVAGTTYRIQVDTTVDAPEGGDVELSLDLQPVPGNDMFADALDLGSSDTAAAAGRNDGASAEAGEPGHHGDARSSVWYSWTAPERGSLTISVDGGPQAIAAAYTGDAVAGLTRLIAHHRDYWEAGVDQLRIRVDAGVTYRIAVDSIHTSDAGDFALSLNRTDSPPNDDFAESETLTGATVDLDGTNVGATEEPCERKDANSYYEPYDPTVWYEWIAPSTGAAVLDVAGELSSVVDVYTGDALCSLTSVPTQGDAELTTIHRFRAVAGETYRIAVNGARGRQDSFHLALHMDSRPANDDLADAVDLGDAATAGADGTNLGATSEPGEPAHSSFWRGQAPGSVWYSWTAPKRGSLTIRATAGFQTVLAAYTGGSIADLERVTNQPQDYNGGSEQIRIRVEAGVTYRIAVDGDREGGDFALGLNLIDRPENDDFAGATVLTGWSIDVDGSNVGATQEPCEPLHENNYYDPSVWYSWTAPSTGIVRLNVTGDLSPAAVGVYTGDSLCGVARVTTTQTGTRRFFEAVEGVTYHIAIDGGGARQASFHLALLRPPPPANDMFSSPQELSGSTATVNGTTLAAGVEPDEPNVAGSAGVSVWYRWTAPSSGRARIVLGLSEYGSHVTAYTGDSVSALTEVQRLMEYARGEYDFRVVAGTTYRIAVDGGYDAVVGAFRLELGLTPAPPNDDFADAEELTGQSDSAEGTNAGATVEADEPEVYPSESRASVWYRWTAPVTGHVTVETADPQQIRMVGVYTGSSLGGLSLIEQGEMTTGFDATAGTTYYIQENGRYSNDVGPFTITLTEAGDGGGADPDPGSTTDPLTEESEPQKDPPVVQKPFRVYPSFGQQNIRGLLSHGLRGMGRCTRACTVDIDLIVERKVVRKLGLPKRLGLRPIGHLRTGGSVYTEIGVKLSKAARKKLRSLERGLPLLVTVRAVAPGGAVATATKYLHLNP
jgi:hypothetical protein